MLVLQKGASDFLYLADLVRSLVKLSAQESATPFLENLLQLPTVVVPLSAPGSETGRSPVQTSTEIPTSNISIEADSHILASANSSTATASSTSDRSTISTVATIQSTSSTTNPTTASINQSFTLTDIQTNQSECKYSLFEVLFFNKYVALCANIIPNMLISCLFLYITCTGNKSKEIMVS